MTSIPAEPQQLPAAPGWYTDPAGAPYMRYWNGTGWTDATQALSGNLTPGTRVSSRSRLAVLLLALFLGMLGVHSFYVGKTGIGAGQIAVTVITLGTLGWIWPLIDVIMCVVGNYTDNEGLPVLNW